MDFEIGNILYIVITLVAVIVGLLGKKKKPAPGDTDGLEGERRPGFLENLERIMTMGQEESLVTDLQPYEEDLPVEEIVQAEEEPFAYFQRSPGILEQYDAIMNRITDGDPQLVMSEGESMLEPLEVEDLDYIPGTDYFEIVKDFDAGTAVVYSAIINRLDI
ncbi:MAG: hypothetical protein P1P86_04785 [Bacteroidales bacterium]|nr:hypothetical protein [Bacteroidales bacterium]